MMYLRFFWQQVKVAGMVVLAFLLFTPLIYPLRKKIWGMRLLPAGERGWYWILSDTSETGFGSETHNYLNSTYGLYELVRKRGINGGWVPDYERFDGFSSFRRFFISFHWLVFRNGAWNYIASVTPAQIVGDDYICIESTGGAPCTTWRNKVLFGKQSCEWPEERPRWFRYSFTKRASWYNIHRLLASIFSLRWYTHFNFMVGHSEDRYLIKIRSFTPDIGESELLGRLPITRIDLRRLDEAVSMGNKHQEDAFMGVRSNYIVGYDYRDEF